MPTPGICFITLPRRSLPIALSLSRRCLLRQLSLPNILTPAALRLCISVLARRRSSAQLLRLRPFLARPVSLPCIAMRPPATAAIEPWIAFGIIKIGTMLIAAAESAIGNSMLLPPVAAIMMRATIWPP